MSILICSITFILNIFSSNTYSYLASEAQGVVSYICLIIRKLESVDKILLISSIPNFMEICLRVHLV
jgi:hypothetical protein